MPASGGLEDSTGTGWDGEQHLLGLTCQPAEDLRTALARGGTVSSTSWGNKKIQNR